MGAAVLALKQGFDVFLSDKGMLKEKYREQLNAHHIPFEEGSHDETRVLIADEIIKSPGIPDTAPLVVEALRSRGASIPVVVGGIVPRQDIPLLKAAGISEVLGPGAPGTAVVDTIRAAANAQ